METNKKQILVIYTGGTIGSVRYTTKDGKVIKGQPKDIMKEYPESKEYFKSSNAVTLLCDRFHNENPNYKSLIYITNRLDMEVLSENMTLDKWNYLLYILSTYNFSNFSGVIITHGTDTLAYTANLLSMIYSNARVPIFLVSSNDSLDVKEANGVANFKAAIDFILNEGIPGVYVPYRNEEEIVDIMYASRVTQCSQIYDCFSSISSNGFSKLGYVLPQGAFCVKDYDLYRELRYRKMVKNSFVIPNGISLDKNIIKIQPYVGLNYNNYSLNECNAILHTCYHSGTSCTIANRDNSILEMIRYCDNNGVDFYYGPIYGEEDKAIYDTTNAVMKAGAKIIKNISEENAYVKLLLGYSMFNNSSDIIKYIETDINKEHIFTRRRTL